MLESDARRDIRCKQRGEDEEECKGHEEVQDKGKWKGNLIKQKDRNEDPDHTEREEAQGYGNIELAKLFVMRKVQQVKAMPAKSPVHFPSLSTFHKVGKNPLKIFFHKIF